MNVFTYGSLMYDSVWSRVVAGTYPKKSGVVKGFARLKVRNEQYPGLIRGHDVVDGVVYFDLTAQDVARLDRFEGELYQREEVEVVCEDEERAPALVYLIRDEYKWILGDQWSPVEFEQAGLAEFTERYVGFTRSDR
jgi:gamma-glutamylcyclotransferase (GGCT)/AIG2-like uncharacterized protein YtfP